MHSVFCLHRVINDDADLIKLIFLREFISLLLPTVVHAAANEILV